MMLDKIEPIAVRNLLLDPDNPRLPEALQGAPQSELFDYLYNYTVLDELVESMLANGFFSHEPLIILPPDSHGNHIVVEGNRRLAALMLLHGMPAAEGHPLPEEATSEALARLKVVPCYVVADREDVQKFLGYRLSAG